jgi:hypothetical protein
VATAGLVVTTALVGGTALPAHAAEPHYSVTYAFLAYTDSATPDETTYWPDRNDLPVGTTVDDDGVRHTNRTYVAFEIGGMNRARLSSAKLATSEYAVDDCSAQRALSVRPIVPFDGHTWADPPATAGPAVSMTATGPQCQETVTADLTTALDRALSRGQDKLWLELRVPQRRETDPRYARRVYDQFRFEVNLTNRPPDKPTELSVWNDDIPCTDDYTVNQDFSGYALMTDPDRNPGDVLSPEFEFWNTATPAVRTPLSTGISYGAEVHGVGHVPAGTLPDGRYGWQARTFDTRAYSPWSDTCHFTVDRTAPATAPTVASPEYPENSPAPTGLVWRNGTFLFTAAGVADVVSFEYGLSRWSMSRVSADQPGGAATVRWAPTTAGEQTLLVRSVDRAGNRSPERAYRINVRDLRVEAYSVAQSADPAGGTAVRMRFATQAGNGITTVVYQVDGGPEQSVAIGADGVAEPVLGALQAGEHRLQYTGRDAAGTVLTYAYDTAFWVVRS